MVAVSRATATASARHIEFMTPRGCGLRVPLGAASRAALNVKAVDLDGVRARSACPLTSLLERLSTSMAAAAYSRRRRASTTTRSCGTPSPSNCDAYSIEYRLAPRAPVPGHARQRHSRPTRPWCTEAPTPRPPCCWARRQMPVLGAQLAAEESRPAGLPQPAGAVLLWPYADFTFSGETVHSNGDLDVLAQFENLAHVWGPAYVGDANPAEPPGVTSPPDLRGLPPLLILAGGTQGRCFPAPNASPRTLGARRARAARCVPRKVHGSMMLPKLDRDRCGDRADRTYLDSRMASVGLQEALRPQPS